MKIERKDLGFAYYDNDGFERKDIFVDEYWYDKEKELWFIPIYFKEDSNDYFDQDWLGLGWETYEEFQEDVAQWLQVTYDRKTGDIVVKNIWDAPNYIDGFDWSLSEKEMDIVKEIIRLCCMEDY